MRVKKFPVALDPLGSLQRFPDPLTGGEVGAPSQSTPPFLSAL